MTLSVLLILLSFVILTVGAELLVRGASSVGLRFGLSPLLVGLTIVAFGTSAPELAVSVKAALAGTGDIAMGNVIGSNLFNVVVILGLAALVRPLSVHLRVLRVDTPLMLAASLIFVLFLLSGGGLARWEGAILFAGILTYVGFSIVNARKQVVPEDVHPLETVGVSSSPMNLALAISLVVGGLLLLVFGARTLVDNAVSLARALEVSEAIIGLTIIAAGTSLPELATSVVASLKKETDIAIGNIVGSNLFNVLCIAGAAGLISPIAIAGIRKADLFWMLATSILLLPLMRTGFKLVRWEGALLLALYGTYVALLLPGE